MDIASSIQNITEEIIKLAKSLERFEIKNLCLAGGVAEFVANGKILKENF